MIHDLIYKLQKYNKRKIINFSINFEYIYTTVDQGMYIIYIEIHDSNSDK